MAAASWKRSAGALARHRKITRSRSAGIPSRCREGGTTSSWAWAPDFGKPAGKGNRFPIAELCGPAHHGGGCQVSDLV